MRALVVLLATLPAAAGTLVTPYGAVIEGDVRVEGDEVVLTKGKRETREPKTDYLLVEDDGGRLLYAPHFGARMRAYEYIARDRKAALAEKLLKGALSARDGALARKLLDLAEANGFTGKEAVALKKRVEDLERRQPTTDAKKAEAVAARLAELVAIHPDLLLARARADDADSLALLREVLRIDPAHVGGQALLAERALKDFPLGPAMLWLDWRLDMESRGAKFLPETELALLQARGTWRKDLYGIEAGQIRIITPVKDTATVGRCLAYGHVACAALAEVFKTSDPKPRLASTLLLLLYPNKDEYLKHSNPVGWELDRAWLETTAGHHSPAEQISRLVWDPSPDTERRTARVFVHELTHHWLTDLNPRYANAELRLHFTAANWIVEGVAEFFEEGIYDPDRGTWSLFDARAASLDAVLAAAKVKRLLPWAEVYAMDNAGFRKLSRKTEDGARIVCRWHLGPLLASPTALFYDQSAATVHFLYHAEGGAYRERLIDYVTNQYTGKRDKMPIDVGFGMSPEELGRKVEAYAEQVAKGWRPEGS